MFNIDYDVIKTNKKHNKQNIEYLNLESGFDIETSSTYIIDWAVIGIVQAS